jgi:HPt (histidine-containing phosphotransfer) domain-containing protein
MALATESEWESDPELKAMRREFVASFEGRWVAIESSLGELRGGSGEAFATALASVAKVAHKLSGAAETYGFPTLTRAAAAFEDWFDRRESGHDPRVACAGAELMIAILKRSVELGKDAPEFGQDPRFESLKG